MYVNSTVAKTNAFAITFTPFVTNINECYSVLRMMLFMFFFYKTCFVSMQCPHWSSSVSILTLFAAERSTWVQNSHRNYGLKSEWIFVWLVFYPAAGHDNVNAYVLFWKLRCEGQEVHLERQQSCHGLMKEILCENPCNYSHRVFHVLYRILYQWNKLTFISFSFSF